MPAAEYLARNGATLVLVETVTGDKPTSVPAGSYYYDLNGNWSIFNATDWVVVNQGAASATPAGDNAIGAVELKDATVDTRAKIAALNALAATDNGIGVAALLLAGSAIIGRVGVDQTTPGTTDRVTAAPAILLTAEKTRPADVNAYAADDAINESASAGTIWTFANAARAAGGGGAIVTASIQTNHAANTALLELDLYTDTITAVNDNAEATKLWADRAKRLTTIRFPALAKETANSDMASARIAVGEVYTCVGTALYGVLRTPAGFTPTSGSIYYLTLAVARD